MTFWMLATSAMAPTPLSPHMSTLDTGCITLTPQETSVSICPDVHGWFHLQHVGVLIKKLPCRHQLQSLVANDMLLRAWGKSADWVKMPLHCGIHRRGNDEVLALVPKVPRASEASQEVVADPV